MHFVLTPHVAATAALLTAGVIAVTPVQPPQLTEIVNPDVQLTARSVANIPANLIESIANIPANEVKGAQALADSLNYGGSWTVLNPLNVLGFDPADPPKIRALLALLLPVPALAGPLADQLNIILQAELPTNAGCAGIPTPCADPLALIGGYFQVPLTQLLSGYTFPTITNPLQWADGTTTNPSWSGQTVRLDLLAPLTSYVESLLEDPSGFEIVPPEQVATTVVNVLKSFNNAFNPYVPGSYSLDPAKTPITADILNALKPILGWTAPDPAEAVPTPDSELPHTPVDTVVVPWSRLSPSSPTDTLQIGADHSEVARDAASDETKPVETKPVETKPVETKPVETESETETGSGTETETETDSQSDTANQTDTDSAPRHRHGTPVRDLIQRLSGHEQSRDQAGSTRGGNAAGQDGDAGNRGDTANHTDRDRETSDSAA